MKCKAIVLGKGLEPDTYVIQVPPNTELKANTELIEPIDLSDFVEPCEPDCSPERHAYHQGQWDLMTKVEEAHKPKAKVVKPKIKPNPKFQDWRSL